MFVSLRRTQTWHLYTKLYKFGWQASANNARMKNSRDLIHGKVVYISIIYRFSDSWLFSLNGYDFYFDHMTGKNREYLQSDCAVTKFLSSDNAFLAFWLVTNQKARNVHWILVTKEDGRNLPRKCNKKWGMPCRELQNTRKFRCHVKFEQDI